MTLHGNLRYILTATLLLLGMAVGSAQAARILFGSVEGGYYANGQQLATYLENDGHTVDRVNLWSTSLTDLSVYDQIWVYDLSTGPNANVNQMFNYNAIADWFDAQTQDLIVDGRIISSYYAGQSEPEWIQNYAEQLDLRSGGLVLGTDHAGTSAGTGAFVDGINHINDALGIGRFQGFYYTNPLEAIVDTASPLYTPTGTHACSFDVTQRCIWDHSSTSFVPTGSQSNTDIFLTPVAYHGNISPDDFSDAYEYAAVATTMGSITFGTCGGLNQPPCVQPMPEPAILVLMGTGLFGLGFVRRRKDRL